MLFASFLPCFLLIEIATREMIVRLLVGNDSHSRPGEISYVINCGRLCRRGRLLEARFLSLYRSGRRAFMTGYPFEISAG